MSSRFPENVAVDRRYNIHEQALNFNREVLMCKLCQFQAQDVVIDYEGYNGLGSATEPVIQPETLEARLKTEQVTQCRVVVHPDAGVTPRELAEQATTMQKALEYFALAWVELRHPEWARNDGSCGRTGFFLHDNLTINTDGAVPDVAVNNDGSLLEPISKLLTR